MQKRNRKRSKRGKEKLKKRLKRSERKKKKDTVSRKSRLLLVIIRFSQQEVKLEEIVMASRIMTEQEIYVVCFGEYEDDLSPERLPLNQCTSPDCNKWMHEDCTHQIPMAI